MRLFSRIRELLEELTSSGEAVGNMLPKLAEQILADETRVELEGRGNVPAARACVSWLRGRSRDASLELRTRLVSKALALWLEVRLPNSQAVTINLNRVTNPIEDAWGVGAWLDEQEPLGDEALDPVLVRLLLEALLHRDRSPERLLGCLVCAHPAVRRETASAMLETGGPAWLEGVSGEPEDAALIATYTRDEVATVLSHFSRRVVEPVRNPMEPAPPPWIFAVLRACGEGVLKDLFSSLEQLCLNDDGRCGALAARALARLGRKSWSNVLSRSKVASGEVLDPMKMLRSQDPRIVDIAAERRVDALRLPPGLVAETTSPLHVLLVDPDPGVRRTAALALSRRGETEWTDIVAGDRKDLVRLSDRGGPESARLILAALRRDKTFEHAATALADLAERSPGALEGLEGALEALLKGHHLHVLEPRALAQIAAVLPPKSHMRWKAINVIDPWTGSSLEVERHGKKEEIAHKVMRFSLEGKANLDELVFWLEKCISCDLLRARRQEVTRLVDAVVVAEGEGGARSLLLSSHPALRKEAATRLAELPPEARVVGGEPEDVRALAELAPQLTVEYLRYLAAFKKCINLSRTPPEPEKMEWFLALARASARPENAGIAPGLLDLCCSHRTVLRSTAAEALVGLGRGDWGAVRGDADDVIRMLAARDPEVVLRGIAVFLNGWADQKLRLPQRQLPVGFEGDPLLFLLGLARPAERSKVVQALALRGEPGWEKLVRGDAGDYRRIAESGRSQAILPLLGGLHDAESRRGAAEAVETLVYLQDPDALIAHVRLARNAWPRRHMDAEERVWARGGHSDWDGCHGVHFDNAEVRHTDYHEEDEEIPFPGDE